MNSDIRSLLKLNKLVLVPSAPDHLTVHAVELPRAINHVLVEVAYEELTVGKDHFALPVLFISQEVSLVVDPVFVNEVKVLVVEGLL